MPIPNEARCAVTVSAKPWAKSLIKDMPNDDLVVKIPFPMITTAPTFCTPAESNPAVVTRVVPLALAAPIVCDGGV